MDINNTMPNGNNLMPKGNNLIPKDVSKGLSTKSITINTQSIADAIIRNMPNPQPVFVAFATVDGPSLTKVMYR
jgi:hypothetical protein